MRILIGIHGSHAQPEQMQAQRETWLFDQFAYTYGADVHEVDYKYFLGDPESSAPDVVHVPFPDGPVWEGHRRTWWLNRKTEALVRYALDNGYDYLFKCDDDTYVRTEALLNSGFEEHDYAGCTEQHWAPVIGKYRWAQGGAGYWLSRRAIDIIGANGLYLARAEDFAVGQLLASHGIDPFHDTRYAPAVTEADLTNPDLITFHKCSPEWMRLLHHQQSR